MDKFKQFMVIGSALILVCLFALPAQALPPRDFGADCLYCDARVIGILFPAVICNGCRSTSHGRSECIPVVSPTCCYEYGAFCEVITVYG